MYRKRKLYIPVDGNLENRFPGLAALQCLLQGVKVTASSPEVEIYKREVIEGVKRRYDLDKLKDGKTFKAYREFFWRIRIDPTKTRPAAEALIRRILAEKPFPTINSLVDAYNMASVNTEIALASFDADKVRGRIIMRPAKPGEEFLGIGMTKPLMLAGGEIVLSDDERLVAIYPHRDAQYTSITLETRNALLLACGVPGIDEATLRHALDVAVAYVTKFCGGTAKQD
jgi:DNA/RNA-binding domain of Phe-tRNA-synthetase-like protein